MDNYIMDRYKKEYNDIIGENISFDVKKMKMSKFRRRVILEIGNITAKLFKERNTLFSDGEPLVLSSDELKEISYYQEILNTVDTWFYTQNIVVPNCVDTDAESYEEALRDISLYDYDNYGDANDEVNTHFSRIKNQIDINDEIISEHQNAIDALEEENEKLEELLSDSFYFPRDDDDYESNDEEYENSGEDEENGGEDEENGGEAIDYDEYMASQEEDDDDDY